MGTELQAHAPTWEPDDDDLEVFDDSDDALAVGETEEHSAKQCSSSAKDFAAEHEQLRTQHDKVAVHIDNVSFNSRKLLASTAIAAPVDIVWALMKDYEHLDTFIPSLVENRCLERRPHGCLLYQVGAQDIALGIKFSAKTTLECIEYEQGISEDLCTHGLEELTELFPWPDGGLPSTAARDISFRQVHGDFHVFHGLWRMQSGLEGETSCLMTYSLFVQPKPWLPVRLIQGRIVSGIVDNLKAIAKHAEEVFSMQLAELDTAGKLGDFDQDDGEEVPVVAFT